MNKANADALARKWMNNEIAPEDFDDSIKEWKLDEAVREAVKFGDVHQKQFVEEVMRRRDAGRFDYNQAPFIERFPLKGVK